QRPVPDRAGVLRPADRQQLGQEGRDLAEGRQGRELGGHVSQFRGRTRAEVEGSEALRLARAVAGADEQPPDPDRHVAEQGAERRTVVAFARACLQRVADWGRPAQVGEMRRLDVTDAQWRRLEPLLPPEKPRTGRPNHNHRRVVSGMLWIHRTGAPWRDRPERYGPVGTVSSRFYRWCRAGVWDRILCALQAEADARGEIDTIGRSGSDRKS